jgi:hypothetical protein
MNRFPHLAVCLALLSVASVANAGSADLDSWISRDLAPYVTKQLTMQPRFKNEPVRFVVLADENPQSASSKLALNIRDRLRDSVAKEPGLHIVWQRDIRHASVSESIDCTKDQAHYYIGIEIVEDRDGRISVDVRALDIEDQSWVAGFGKTWRGYPNSFQKRQLRQTQSDSSFRGNRSAPFDESQFDLLAAHLAHELGCALLRQTAGEYVVNGSTHKPVDEAEEAMLELVRNNLADFRAVQFSGNDTNALIAGKAHQIDNDLYQYWVTITPSEANSDLQAISASAYIRIQDKYAVAKLVPSVSLPVARSDNGFLSELKIVELRDVRSCASGSGTFGDSRVFNSSYSSSAVNCYALEIGASSDSVVFFLNHQLNNGLVRLSGQSCGYRTDAKIARVDEQLHFPLPSDSLMSDSWVAADGWQLNPDQDTYYVVAAADTKAARALSKHISQLPNRCSASVRSGLEGLELQRWMDKFASIAKHWKQSVDWQVIRVKNIY